MSLGPEMYVSDVENVREALAALRERLSEAEQSLRALADAELDARARATPGPALLDATDRSHLVDERLLRAVFDGALDAMVLVSEEGSCLEVNPAACALLGRSREELLGTNISELDGLFAENGAPLSRRRVRSRTSGHFPLVRANGTARRVEYSTTPDIGAGLHLVVLRDVTEQIAATEALRRSEDRLRTVIHNAPLMLFALDENAVHTFCDGQALRSTRRSPDDIIGKSIYEVMADTPPAKELVRKALAGETVSWSSELGGIPFETRLMPLRDGRGHVHGAIGVSLDVMDRRRVTEELRASEQRYRRIVETTTEGVWQVDATAQTTFANARMAEMLQLPAEGLMGRSIFSFVKPEQHELLKRKLELGSKEATEHEDLELIRRDGTSMWASLQATPLRDDDGRYEGALAMVTDISGRKRAEQALRRSEEQLRQAQKLEALGSLAGGVAHDFNNLLSIILTQVSLVLDDLSPDDALAEDITLIRRAGERGAELTRQLLAFSRQQILQPRILDLNDTILGMDKMLRRLIREDIGLSLITASGLGKVKADPGQVEQVIMNLVVNARDAMPQGGTLKIETRNVDLDSSSDASHSGVGPGSYVLLCVSDGGIGMTREIQARIFEPFFTTKPKGKGTGLGLSTVFGIVQQSGGQITVESEPGEGTTFRIYLPRVAREAASDPAAFAAPATIRGSETILLVEDDEEVLSTASRTLRRLGYEVLEAQNGGEALLICEQHPNDIDLVVTDLVMPLMNGRQLAERLGSMHPTMKFLFMSGYTDDFVVRDQAHGAGISFVHKPLTPATFAKKVREVLDAGYRVLP